MQGFNMGRYVPPELEGVASGNQVAGKHALGARARKLKSEGALTVRFEMPFAVWCGTCSPAVVIGQGVRFNAEKRRVGSYYSSPVYGFRMRHAACGGWIEVRTDPQNTAYVVVSGGRKRDTGEGKDDGADGGSLVGGAAGVVGPVIKTAREQAEEREVAFANLEKTIEDRAALAAARERIDEIEDVNAKQWDDPYTRNQMLRKSFRVGRKQREKNAAADEDLKDRMGLGIDLLPESEEDARWAKLVDFGTRAEGLGEREEKVLARPLFGGARPAVQEKPARDSKPAAKKLLKSEIAATKMRESLVSEIVGNTRMASDPFLEPRSRDPTRSTASFLPGLKRKRQPATEPSPPPEDKPVEKGAAVSSALVDYDSD
ncbi:Protein saf4 [Diaporthe australafricana]|uniref:Protein saf4 n=1 Tax=Diaporthe australafricana TaxID=127596 RepID=A0ABR3WP95_9PEZI